MHYEVEQKFPLDDLAAIEAGLVALGARFESAVEQVDRYFAHPSRDFAQTDEALADSADRHAVLRHLQRAQSRSGNQDPAREIELPLGGTAEAAAQWTSLLEALGFRGVAEVRKRRRPARLAWQGAEIEIALDQVEGVGTFVEFELSASAEGLVQARSQILSLAAALELSNAERRSYLELLLGRRMR